MIFQRSIFSMLSAPNQEPLTLFATLVAMLKNKQTIGLKVCTIINVNIRNQDKASKLKWMHGQIVW